MQIILKLFDRGDQKGPKRWPKEKEAPKGGDTTVLVTAPGSVLGKPVPLAYSLHATRHSNSAMFQIEPMKDEYTDCIIRSIIQFVLFHK